MYAVEPSRLWRSPPRPPPVMYELPSRTESFVEQTPPEKLASLEERQQKLIDKLEKLRERMENAKKSLLPTGGDAAPAKEALPSDVVINAAPEFVPYYLLTFQKLLRIRVDCHTHSSVKSLPSTAERFARELTNSNRADPDITVTLIWKEVGLTNELVISSCPVVIQGDANILRYFAALASSRFSYHGHPDSWKIDSILDTCYRLQVQKTPQERKNLIRQLSSKLGDASEITIADIAAWNAIKQLQLQSEIGNMKGWYEKCQQFCA